MYSWVTVHMWMSELGFSSPCPQCAFQDSTRVIGLGRKPPYPWSYLTGPVSAFPGVIMSGYF